MLYVVTANVATSMVLLNSSYAMPCVVMANNTPTASWCICWVRQLQMV